MIEQVTANRSFSRPLKIIALNTTTTINNNNNLVIIIKIKIIINQFKIVTIFNR